MIKHTTKTNDKTKASPQDFGNQVIFFALNFIALPFSAWQTYKGYRDVAAGDNEIEKIIFPALLALISAILFFGLNYVIMDNRRKGRPHIWQTIGYIIPLGISFFGNFNSFYSNQMKGALLDEEIANYETKLIETKEESLSAIYASTGLNKLKNDISNELGALKRSYYGDGIHEGWGDDCRNHWKNIEQILGGQNIILSDPNYPNASSAINSIMGSRENYLKNSVQYEINLIDTEFSKISLKIKRLKTDPILLSKEGGYVLDEIRKVNNLIGTTTKSYLTKKALIKNPNYSYTILTSSNQRQIGTIKHTLSSAFIKWDQPTATVFALFFSIIIDLAVLIFIFLAYPYNKAKGYNFNGPRKL